MDQYERESQLRFFSNVDFSDGCWNWTAGIDSQKKPYGRFYYRGRTMRAHVWSYNYFHADKKDGYLICHHCDNPRCVNPWHLFQGTNRENIYDAIEKNRVPQLTEPPKHLHKDYKTHCKWGHEFTEENTYYVVSTNKSLSCNLGSNSQGKAMTNYEKERDEAAEKYCQNERFAKQLTGGSTPRENVFNAGADWSNARAEKRIQELEGQLRFASGYISTTEGFTDKHPEDVLQWIGIEWDKIQQYDGQTYNQK